MLLLAIITLLLAVGMVRLPWPWPGEVSYGSDAIVRESGPANATNAQRTETYERQTVHFRSHGEDLEAWLYLPGRPDPDSVTDAASGESSGAPLSCIVMAHGLGGQRDFGLQRYAQVFASAKYAVLAFDYRNFGGSSGEPRNWVSPSRHVEDWVEAIHAMQPGGPLPSAYGFQCSGLALWGTSFSGGHVLVAAARAAPEVTIKAIMSQVPHLSGIEASKTSLKQRGLWGAVRLLMVGLHDSLRSRLGLSAAYIRLVGRPGQLVFMQLSEEQERLYYAKHPAVRLGGWTPWAPARLSLEISRYSPVLSLPKLTSPVLFISALRDTLCLPGVIRRTAEACGGRCQLIEYDVDHFGIYGGDVFDKVTEEMLGFLNTNMRDQDGSPP